LEGVPAMLFVTALSVFAAIFLVANGDYGWFGKLLAVGLEAGSVLLMFVKPVHFLVPFFMQLFVCIWYLLDRKLNG
jgi:hypothetical protein